MDFSPGGTSPEPQPPDPPPNQPAGPSEMSIPVHGTAAPWPAPSPTGPTQQHPLPVRRRIAWQAKWRRFLRARGPSLLDFTRRPGVSQVINKQKHDSGTAHLWLPPHPLRLLPEQRLGVGRDRRLGLPPLVSLLAAPKSTRQYQSVVENAFIHARCVNALHSQAFY